MYTFAKNIQAPVELVKKTKELGRLPVVNFAAGGVATPADAALMMQVCVCRTNDARHTRSITAFYGTRFSSFSRSFEQIQPWIVLSGPHPKKRANCDLNHL